jgi:formate/nitrite transporter FocA (FNT family)
MYFIPLAIFLKGSVAAPAGIDLASLDWSGFAGNLIPVTLGNIVGGSVMVALIYHLVYRRGLKA